MKSNHYVLRQFSFISLSKLCTAWTDFMSPLKLQISRSTIVHCSKTSERHFENISDLKSPEASPPRSGSGHQRAPEQSDVQPAGVRVVLMNIEDLNIGPIQFLYPPGLACILLQHEAMYSHSLSVDPRTSNGSKGTGA